MFKGLGQLVSLFQNLPKMKAELESLQQRLAHFVVEGNAGGGMVKVRVNGKLEVLACDVSAELFCMNDKEMLEDLVRSATNQALDRARLQAAQETGKLAQGFELPAGMGLPGLTQ
jgi:nucleoid-associated protein EbfC